MLTPNSPSTALAGRLRHSRTYRFRPQTPPGLPPKLGDRRHFRQTPQASTISSLGGPDHLRNEGRCPLLCDGSGDGCESPRPCPHNDAEGMKCTHRFRPRTPPGPPPELRDRRFPRQIPQAFTIFSPGGPGLLRDYGPRPSLCGGSDGGCEPSHSGSHCEVDGTGVDASGPCYDAGSENPNQDYQYETQSKKIRKTDTGCDTSCRGRVTLTPANFRRVVAGPAPYPAAAATLAEVTAGWRCRPESIGLRSRRRTHIWALGPPRRPAIALNPSSHRVRSRRGGADPIPSAHTHTHTHTRTLY
ncbi:unnamed protein product [Diatraea saccharalis]|uniref:Uncharacterized protein n=1 Tax=Diatraea saccharalis TaxID=40085 RepID=A0A9N9W770_9NEOP|nr:unnamed protein product [Diatraea saccharalis]